jgi:hypothetical protein
MKTLLITILLLIGSVCQAQNQFVLEKIDTTSCDSVDAERFIITFSTFLEYQTGCYNDSLKGPTIEELPDTGDGIYRTIEYLVPHYLHKEPTFIGFIEYVKKKYKVR